MNFLTEGEFFKCYGTGRMAVINACRDAMIGNDKINDVLRNTGGCSDYELYVMAYIGKVKEGK